ncbi:MAG: YIEGIA family protein [Peptococcaceae bacterium]|nr:YIEGIA family protein [Peptococcaceae bacterium]
MDGYLGMIIAGTVAGALARLLLLRVDYRQYPGYPHGTVAHISLGFIASALGAVAVPAILKPDFTAVTFLALAAQQFREIRGMERKTLENLEKYELVKRGSDYIEGIARTFEARNYLVMATSMSVSAAYYLGGLPGALLIAFLFTAFSLTFKSGETIGDICEVHPASINFDGSRLKVDEIVIMNVGLREMREKILNEALAVRIKPKGANAMSVINDIGQRMAIAHTAATILGIKKDIDTPELTPLVRKNLDTGELGMYILPVVKNMEALILAVKRTPVLESARSKPLSTEAGRIAAEKHDRHGR